ncbi:MAG: MazG family protein [Candidatus Dormibacteria bacterium]|jgi:XTP/dITP diphosphohydrolase
MREEAAKSLRELNEVVERLRAPGGCPWDRAQTHRSLRPYLLEETYETLEAIDSQGTATLREELGDLLLQVLMHSAIAAERPDGFDIGDVAETTRAKMVHRHPHVFGGTTVAGAEEVVVNWEKLKRAEKRERLSLLEGVPHALPALAFAQGVQKRPARVGFDETPTVAAALAWLREGVDALAALAAEAPVRAERGADWSPGSADTASGEGLDAPEPAEPPAAPVAGHAPPPPPASRALEEATGELLFAAVALARQLRVNPEDALRARAVGFAARFRSLETAARADGVDLHDLDAEEWRRRWEATA